ncbi:helix-turn-helix domain-containing protein [Legionella dresdenensis]|uniref:Helix-turn-helix domain-containing protein n=1 Tax=Legionella dresdenensis TaxID=450200 RepID=A0ABV8CFM8_9GAMM
MTEKNHPVAQLGNHKSKRPLHDNSSSSQRARLLKYLKAYSQLSTLHARQHLGILHPCGRIMELRRRGHQIETHWVIEIDSNGVLHRVGLYIYKGNANGGHHE